MAVIEESCRCQEEVVSKSLLIAKEFFKERSHFFNECSCRESWRESKDSTVMMNLAEGHGMSSFLCFL